MARELTLASAGGARFIRPLETLMQMVYERVGHTTHLDAWSHRNGDTVSYDPPWPNQQAETYNIFRCLDFWRCSGSGIMQPGTAQRWEAWEDWDLGYPFGLSHDNRLNLFGTAIHAINRRFVLETEAADKSAYTFLDQTPMPQLVLSPYDAQLTTVDHFEDPDGDFEIALLSDRLAMPISGQGLISCVRITATPGNITDNAAWLAALPENTATPPYGGGSGLIMQVCENNSGVPGTVIETVLLHQSQSPNPELSQFFLHRPLVLDHTKVFWLVLRMPASIPEENIVPISVGLSSAAHEDTPYQLKIWNGTAWEDHESPAIAFSLHMPKFMWRAKQLWLRVDEFRNQIHWRGLFHSYEKFEWGGGISYASDDGGYPRAKSEEIAYAGGNYSIQYFDDTDGDYAASVLSPYNSGVGSTEATQQSVPGPPSNPPGVTSCYASLFGINYKLKERKINAWRATARCAQFEYRTGLSQATPSSSTGVFVLDEVIVLTGGVAVADNNRAVIKITAVDEDGAPTEITVLAAGSYLKFESPQRGTLSSWASGGRSIYMGVSMKIVEVIVVDQGSGYVSDTVVQVQSAPNSVTTHARLRGHREGLNIIRVDILDAGEGYVDGGIAVSLERLDASYSPTADPASRQIWPGVTYFIRSTGHRGYYGIIGDYSPDLGDAVVTYNGVEYGFGESFTGVSGVPDYIGGNEWNPAGAPGVYVSSGIDGWCHSFLGWGYGSQRVDWPGSGVLATRAKGDKSGPGAFPLVSADYQVAGSMINNVDFYGSWVGTGLGFVTPDAPPSAEYSATWEMDGIFYFTKPEFLVDLLGSGSTGAPGGEGGGGSGGLPDEAEGDVTINVGASGEAGISEADVASDLLFCWPMNEASGTRESALGSGNGLVEALGSVSAVTGKSGNAVQVGGSTTHLAGNINVTAALDGSAPITLAAWVKVATDHSTPGYEVTELVGMFSPGTTAAQLAFYRSQSEEDGPYRFTAFVVGNPLRAPADIDATTWNHLVFTYDGTDRCRFYVNGTMVDQATIPIEEMVGLDFRVGGPYSGSTQVDETLIYSRELTPADVLLLHNTGAGLFYPFTL